jgi:hypothetical protein
LYHETPTLRAAADKALHVDYDLQHGQSNITDEHIDFIKAQVYADQ